MSDSLLIFLLFTGGIMGGAAWLTGRALGSSWKPVWLLGVYCLLLVLADRFLVFALFSGELLALKGIVLDGLLIFAIGFVSFRAARIHRMARQYPWLYQRKGIFWLTERANDS